jgi:hypothetical protein
MPIALSDRQWEIVREGARGVPYDLRDRYLLSLVAELDQCRRPLADADVVAATARAANVRSAA